MHKTSLEHFRAQGVHSVDIVLTPSPHMHMPTTHTHSESTASSGVRVGERRHGGGRTGEQSHIMMGFGDGI